MGLLEILASIFLIAGVVGFTLNMAEGLIHIFLAMALILFLSKFFGARYR